MVRIDQLVTVGGGFAEAGAGDQQQVRFANALLQLRVGAVTELASINAAVIADRVLAAECGGCWYAIAEREGREMMGRITVPPIFSECFPLTMERLSAKCQT